MHQVGVAPSQDLRRSGCSRRPGRDKQEAVIPRQRCDGCLGSRSCWVCLGHGTLPSRYGVSLDCRRCDGSGVCSVCASSAVVVGLRATESAAS
jgi:hypothetical protein